MTYIWSHEPEITAEPVERLEHDYFENGVEVQESAVYRLANENFLYIRYVGLLTDPTLGITDIDEFDDFVSAKDLFDLYKVK